MVWHGIGIGWSTARCGITTCKSPPLHSTLCDLVSSWFGMVLFGLIYYNIIWLGIVCYGIISCHMWGHYLQVGTHLPLTVTTHTPSLPSCFLSCKYPSFKWSHLYFFAIFLCELSLCDWTNGFCLSHFFLDQKYVTLTIIFIPTSLFNLGSSKIFHIHIVSKMMEFLSTCRIINCQEQVSGFFC